MGHGGASALARGNTLASFDAALAVGVDEIEFDVRAWRGELVLAHTVLHARRGPSVTLQSALEHLAAPRFDGIGLHVDLKHGGCEELVLRQLREHGLSERIVICSQVASVLDRVRQLDPSVRTGISVAGRVARASHRWGDWRARVLQGLSEGRWDVLMAQHRLVDAGLVDDVGRRGALLYAWTVNERSAMDALRRVGVHGITTADPRLFA